METGFERVQEVACEVTKLFKTADNMIDAKDPDWNTIGILRDEAETRMYEMFGLALIFDSPSMWPIVDLYKASEVMFEEVGDDIPLIQRAYDMLKEYAEKTTKSKES
jgi:hypothetical protein